MARLNDIPRKEFFTTPPEYFDKLPAQIQSRVHPKAGRSRAYAALRYSLYALPLILIAAILFFSGPSDPDVETIIATVESEELILYLHESGVTTEDLMESIDFSQADLEEIENEIYAESFSEADSMSIDL